MPIAFSMGPASFLYSVCADFQHAIQINPHLQEVFTYCLKGASRLPGPSSQKTLDGSHC